MAWLTKMKLGRAAYESVFELNPSAMTMQPRKIEDFGRGLDGGGIDPTISPNRPTFTINGNYITPDQMKQFESLLHIDYEPLVLIPVDYSGDMVFEVWQERVIAATATTFAIAKTSAERAGVLKQLNGSTAVIRPVGLWAQMAATHGRTGVGSNLIAPGLWGKILVEDFNLLPTGLLANAGKNWLIQGGNGTTRDFFVDTTAPIEGAKDLVATTDGTGGGLSALRTNGGLWNPTSPFIQGGFDAEFHTAEWEMQVIDNTTGTAVSAVTQGDAGESWAVFITVTGPAAATYEWRHNGVQVVAPTALANPFLAHTYEVIVTPTTVEFRIDTVQVYLQTATTRVFNEFVAGLAPAFGAPSGIAAHWDDININDGDGYYPADKEFNLQSGATLTPGSPYFLTYQYAAVAVNMDAIPFTVNGGWVNILRYNFNLEGM